MQAVQIFADRFLVDADGRAIDLADGSPIAIEIHVGGGAAEQVRWAERCDALSRIAHPVLARLVDFGGVGESRRFEAWRSGPRASGGSETDGRATREAARLLAACGLTEGILVPENVRMCDGRPVVIPGEGSGYPVADGASAVLSSGAWPLHELAIGFVDRPADSMLADLFSTLDGSRPHIVSIWGPPGAGCTTVGVRAARVARLNGLIPVCGRMAGRVSGDLLEGRRLCLISDEADRPAWTGLLNWTLTSPRPHVVLRLGRGDRDPVLAADALHGVSLDRIPADVLADAVRPRVNGDVHARLLRVANEARGWPGRFAAALWTGRRTSYARAKGAGSGARVAEQSPAYVVTSSRVHPPSTIPAATETHQRPGAPAELLVFQQKADAAAVLLRRGRHAPAVRQLRQVYGALHRRRDWVSAGTVALTLGAALLRRGDVRGALTAVDEGRGCAEQTGCNAGLIDAAILAGHARIDAVRLDEAESVIGTALAVAQRTEDSSRSQTAALALGRCLFWQGRYAEATALLAPLRSCVTRDLAVRLFAALARSAVGAGNLPEASSLAGEAVRQAANQDDPALTAHASLAAAFVHLSVCDLDGVARDVWACVAMSRRAHDPLIATKARLLLAESERRRRRPPSSFVTRVRAMAPRLPPLLRARADLLHALLQADEGDWSEVAARQAIRSGLPALRLFVEATSDARAQAGAWTESSAADVVGILHLCQAAEDEASLLGKVCSRVRRQLHAAAVALFVPQGTGAIALASDGARVEAALALRAMSAGQTLAPHRIDERLESAAPVRYGGASIGALVARWPPGTPYDLSCAPAVLTMAATASAPVVAAALAHKSKPAVPALDDLIGVTTRMSELRRAIERAAAAPFAVLVEGESGSGKELVARALHRAGLRRDRAFCTLNCAALPDDLVEAELFGHARGAFTGAVHERAGVFEEAHGGTLLLDEVGELSPRAQAKLLRVIQEGELRRIGENTARRVDVRVVAATNRDLRREVAEGRFRLDLLYRLDVIRLAVPPLRDRREDIGVLAEHCWREATARIGSRAVLSAATLAALARYDWPGNVRELQNVLAALAVRTPRRGVVTPDALPAHFTESRASEACRLDDARRIFEERFVRAALVRCGGHRVRAAEELGISRQGLTKLMARLRIAERPKPSESP